jgi:DNA polymerase I
MRAMNDLVSSPDSLPTLLLVDGSSYLYRAFHAMPDLRGPQGEPTGALHGMVNMLRLLRKQVVSSHAVCVFDAKGPTFRDEWFAEYKAHRPAMPEDLVAQLAPIHEVVKLLGWPVLEVPGIEADDAIGTLCVVAAQAGYKVVVSTGDKDLAQLVNERVTLVNTMSNETLNEAGVLAKFGVPPNRIIDYLTLVGDTVDNIPGVEKVGPKTAAKWIAEHGSLEQLVAVADTIKGVAGENLRKALDWLPQGRRLITVRTDCDLHDHVPQWPALDALALREPDPTALKAFALVHGFKTWVRELEQAIGAPPAAKVKAKLAKSGGTNDLFGADAEVDDEVVEALPHDTVSTQYDTVTDWPTFDRWLAKIKAAEITAFDTETDSLEPMKARIVGLSFSVTVGEAAYIPLAHQGPDATEQLSLDEVLARLKPWLEGVQHFKVGQNIKYDSHVLANHGISVQGYVHDTMLQSYVLEAHKPHGLESLALRFLNRKGLSYEDVAGKGAQQIPFAQVAVDRAAQYSCEDSDLTLHLHCGPNCRPRPLCRMFTSAWRCRSPACCSASSATAC